LTEFAEISSINSFPEGLCLFAFSVLNKLQEGYDSGHHSLAVDPLFVDPENGDFRFQENSPALKMGIIPFDVSKVGLKEE